MTLKNNNSNVKNMNVRKTMHMKESIINNYNASSATVFFFRYIFLEKYNLKRAKSRFD